MKPGKRQFGPSSLRLTYSQLIAPSLRGRLLELSQLHTEEGERGKGCATALLQSVCAEADAGGKTLMLTADNEKLARTYERMGFGVIQQQPIVMVRTPH